MAPIPRYRPQSGPAVLSAGFRPFFLLAAVWACLVVPASIASFAGWIQPPTAFPLNVWHAHEMAFGYGGAVVAGFLLTAIPNWTGRMPLQGVPLALLVLLWLCGRIAVLLSGRIGVGVAAAVDLSFPALFLIVIAREIIAGRNWRNLPMLGALMLLLLGNVLTHFDALGIATTFDIGNRLGVATLLMLVSLIGGRIVPSFTRNWLVKQDPKAATPASFDLVDRIALAATAVALSAWVIDARGEVDALARTCRGCRARRAVCALARRENLARAATVGFASWLWMAVARVPAAGLQQPRIDTAADDRLACAYRREPLGR